PDVVDGELPVAVDDPLLDPADDPGVAGAVNDVEADAADLSQVVVEVRSIVVESCEDEAVVALGASGNQAPFLALEVLVVIVLESGNADELALQVVSPAMVGAHEGGGVTLLGPADRVAPVAAGIEQDLGVSFLVPHGDYAVLADVVHEEVARVRDLRVV